LRPFRFHITFSLVFALLLLAGFPALAQNIQQQRKELENKRKELTDKIKETKKVLEETRTRQKTTLSQLKTINNQIRTREKIINNVQEQLQAVSIQILEQQAVLDSLKRDMVRLKEEYAKSIRASYKTRNVYDKMLFVFSAKSFNQALKRISYLNQYSDYRKNQAKVILQTQQLIVAELTKMIAIKNEKMAILGLKEEEKKELEKDKQEESQVLAKLKAREGELRKILAENEKSARKLNKAIGDLIAREIELARKREEEARKKEETAGAVKKEAPKTVSKEMYLTPEALKLSNDFESNRNSLPWPVEKGYISEQFGTHAHPTLKGVVINNNGVDISTQPGASVRAIFKGKVKSIFSIPGMGKIVLISHGKYFTAYAKLSSVLVKEGQEVDTRDTIGTVLTNEEEDVTEVHLEIWNMSQKLDPETWLKN
jgi:septal ring factor EnvC (AmiA/AmiB activator)